MTTITTRRMRMGMLLAATLAVTGLTGLAAAPATAAPAASATPLTNLAHLDFLLDTAEPVAVDGHTTYRLDEEPQLVLPWTYADARDGGTFERVGGGPLDAATGDWGQGAYNADDVARAAVVYLRHWQLTGEDSSRTRPTRCCDRSPTCRPRRGRTPATSCCGCSPTATLNPSAEPVELPDPSDSGPSYWTARALWAFGEGYAAFAESGTADDAAFASFLGERLALSRAAVDTQVLSRYGEYEQSDGLKVPAWLIVDGADASAEAVLGLSAYVDASGDPAARETLRKLAEGIAAMGAASGADTRSWPYGAILPWAQSRSMWHAWGSQMPAALAAASGTLGTPSLLKPAVRDAAVFTPTLLLAGGPDNGWFPTPTDTTQIAYGADSRLQSLLAVADATGSAAFDQLAAMQAAWFFGANRASAPMYDPATGVTFDGLAPDGTINRNGGAESTIHGLLSMIALDARPDVAARAQGVTTVSQRDGLHLLEAETGSGGEVSTPAFSVDRRVPLQRRRAHGEDRLQGRLPDRRRRPAAGRGVGAVGRAGRPGAVVVDERHPAPRAALDPRSSAGHQPDAGGAAAAGPAAAGSGPRHHGDGSSARRNSSHRQPHRAPSGVADAAERSGRRHAAAAVGRPHPVARDSRSGSRGVTERLRRVGTAGEPARHRGIRQDGAPRRRIRRGHPVDRERVRRVAGWRSG